MKWLTPKPHLYFIILLFTMPHEMYNNNETEKKPNSNQIFRNAILQLFTTVCFEKPARRVCVLTPTTKSI